MAPPADGEQAGQEATAIAATRTNSAGSQQLPVQMGRTGSLRNGREAGGDPDSSVRSGRFSLRGGREVADSSVHSGRFSLRGAHTRDSSTHSSTRQEHYDQALRQEYVLEALSMGPAAIGAAGKAAEDERRHGEFDVDIEQAHIVVEEPQRPLSWSDFGSYFKRLPHKLRGGLDCRLPIPPWPEFLFAFLGSFLGILSVSALNQWVSPEIDLPLLVGSFGASAVLLFAVVESKLSQPWNFMGGQVLSSVVGVVVRLVIPVTWIAQPVAVSLAIVAMMLTATTHPPGGATALIVAGAATLPKWAGFSYTVTVLFGSVVMQIVALIVNNLNPARSYPTFWL